MEFKLPPKEITSKEGHIYQLKQPLYRQPLFWTTLISALISLGLLLFSVVMIFVTIGLNQENESLRVINDYTDAYYQYANDYTTYPIGEKVEFDGLNVTVNSISIDKSRKMSDEATGTPVVVKVTFENRGQSSILISPYDFDLYGTDDEIYLLDSSTFNNAQIGKNLAVGESVTLELIFDGEDGQDNNYNVTYQQARWNRDPLAVS